MHNLDSRTLRFLTHLHRGGNYAFWWTAPDKQSHWWEVGSPAPVPNGHRNVYFPVNPVRSIPPTNSEGIERPPAAVRSQIPYIAAINCLYAEFDFKDFASPAAARDHVDELLPPPSIVISSGGGLHCYWLLAQPYLLDTDARRERAQHAQADFVQRVGADTGAKDLARVLRLPGTHNYKPAYAPDYPEVSYIKCDFDLIYILDDLIPRRQPKITTPFTVNPETDEAAKAKRALDRLSASRRENYADWLAVGMSLRKLSSEGLRLWEAWSSGSAKYKSGECERKWKTFQGREQLTLGSLYHWANEDDPGGKPHYEAPQHKRDTGIEFVEAEPTPEPRDRRPLQRRLKLERNIVEDERHIYTLEEVRTMLEDRAKQHIERKSGSALVMAMPPGTGKTYRAVKTAEWCATQGMRVLVLGPRRDFFADVIRFADRPDWWYDWLPRQEGSEGQLQTCLYVPEITLWLNKGYNAMDFCSNGKICGWNYVNQGIEEVKDGHALHSCRGCKYHAQKGVGYPIIFGRHQHLTMGHPLMKTFDVIIGDELPLDAFLRHWTITQRHIAPSGMDIRDPFTEIVHKLSSLTGDKVAAEGPNLLTLLGGAEYVQEACENWQVRIDEQFIKPNLKSAGAVENVPYFHLLHLARLLYRESLAAQTGHDYPHRVALNNERLHLLLRRNINDEALGKPMIWLDATANEHLYSAMFAPMPVEVVTPHVQLTGNVYQIWNRSNNKGSFFTGNEGLAIDTKDNRPKLEQALLQIKRIIERGNYKRPLIMTYKDLVPFFVSEGYEAAHFYAARGTNRYEECDVVIVLGTPQPGLVEIEKAARMLFFDRMEPFTAEWSERDVPYAGQSFSYPVSGFWHDEDLQAMLWQQREAELIQSSHRIRPIWRKADVYLLTNIPLDGVPPNELLTINDLFDAPGNVDPYQWQEINGYAVEMEQAHGYVTTADLVQKFGISKPTADKYIDHIAEAHDWPIVRATGRGRGRPAKAAGRNGISKVT